MKTAKPIAAFVVGVCCILAGCNLFPIDLGELIPNVPRETVVSGPDGVTTPAPVPFPWEGLLAFAGSAMIWYSGKAGYRKFRPAK